MRVSPPDQVKYLRSLPSVRDSCRRVFRLAKADKLPHFSVVESKIPALADYVITVIRQSYPSPNEVRVPFHSRWRHFETGDPQRVEKMTSSWHCDQLETARRLVDLAIVSVLLDAGAGPSWRYQEPGTDNVYRRSEGLGVASLHMFQAGSFSADPINEPHRVDARALAHLPDDAITTAFQVTEANPLLGCMGRTDLLKRLGTSIANYPEFLREQTGPFGLAIWWNI
uniref:DUF1688 domain-containing protein n=1 Tax=Peronospora matthiolae TaxID=2874970 RepID=A0AAV1TWL8_9STRA